MGMGKVNVYSEDGKIVARVQVNTNLDFYDGNNWTSGSTGDHKGLTKLKDGRFVLIHTTQWQGERDYAEIISEKDAIIEILESGNDELLEQFGLQEKAQQMLIPEEETEE